MKVTLNQFNDLVTALEDENLEFKEAKTGFNFETLGKYCAALANEGGGKVVLGVTDKRPRRIVGTGAFEQIERTRRGLIEKLHIRIDVSEIAHPDGRVLVFDIPPHPVGSAIRYDGVYWARSADSLVPMPEEQLRDIFAEGGRDFSGDICERASLDDLNSQGIEEFRKRWAAKSGNPALKNLPIEQLLHDAGVVQDDDVTYAALILFGKREALGRYLPQAELVFEYRSSDASGPASQRKEYRDGFFCFYDDLWHTINLRNDMQHYRDGLFVFDIPTFTEGPVREAILNAVSHRDYQLAGSIFIRQYPHRLVMESPGGFPRGITIENILDRQSPRNRRVAGVFARCGLVERSGQGVNLMFEQSIREGKPLPDFTGTDSYQVNLTLHGHIRDPRFIQFLERVGQEKLQSYSTQDFIILDLVHREQSISPHLEQRLRDLIDDGVVETFGRGRGVRYILSRRFYGLTGRKGVYTRKKGLDRDTNKQLLVKHIDENQEDGSKLADLLQVLPGLSRYQVQTLLRELKAEGRIRPVGTTNAARWYPVVSPSGLRPGE